MNNDDEDDFVVDHAPYISTAGDTYPVENHPLPKYGNWGLERPPLEPRTKWGRTLRELEVGQCFTIPKEDLKNLTGRDIHRQAHILHIEVVMVKGRKSKGVRVWRTK